MSNVVHDAMWRWREILVALGVDAHYLQNKHGPCPICGGKDRYRWDDKRGRGDWYCNGCGHGDGFDLLEKVCGLKFAEASKAVQSVVGALRPARRNDQVRTDARRVLRRISQSLTTGSDAIERYLAGRGIPRPSISCMTELKLATAQPYYEDHKQIATYDAMVARVSSPDGLTSSFHLTYLSRGGKAPVKAPKKIMPPVRPLAGGAIRLFEAGDALGIAEGIETAAACHAMFGVPTWSAMNANMLESFVPPEHVSELFVFGDSDASYTGQRAAYALAHRLTIERPNVQVHVMIPDRLNTDWLDVLNARADHECHTSDEHCAGARRVQVA